MLIISKPLVEIEKEQIEHGRYRVRLGLHCVHLAESIFDPSLYCDVFFKKRGEIKMEIEFYHDSRYQDPIHCKNGEKNRIVVFA